MVLQWRRIIVLTRWQVVCWLCVSRSPRCSFLCHSEPDRHCSKQGKNVFWQVVFCPSNSGSCLDCALLCHCRHGSRFLPRTFRYPGSRSCCGISGVGQVHPGRASPSHIPCLYCCLGLIFVTHFSDQPLGLGHQNA